MKQLTGPKFVNDIRDPLIAFIFDEMYARRISLGRMAKISGVSLHTLGEWRREKHGPILSNYVAVLNALGYDLAIIADSGPSVVRVIKKGIFDEKVSCH